MGKGTTGFFHVDCFCKMVGTHVKNCFTGADPRIPGSLIKTTFLGKVETGIKSGFMSRFNIMGFRTREAIWGLYFILFYFFFHFNSRKSRNQELCI